MVLREARSASLVPSGASPDGPPALVAAQPFLRWAGGKRWLVPTIRQLLPKSVNHYVEPFLGSGAVFFGIAPTSAWLSDRNRELIETYWAVRDEPDRVIELLSHKSLTKERFGIEAGRVPSSRPARAARFIFLNRTAWNGLYRVNRKGRFNVPFGAPRSSTSGTQVAIRRASSALNGIRVGWMDFAAAISRAGKRDLVFADPPYTVTHGDNGFRSYNSRIFSWADQERLRKELAGLVERGGDFLLSNADHQSVIQLYHGYSIYRITRTSVIAADPTCRRPVTELVITNLRPVSPPEGCRLLSPSAH